MLKNIYQIIPFKKQFFTLLKGVYKPPVKLYKHLHFKGIFNVKISKDESFKIKHFGNVIENELFWEGIHGGWEKVSLGLWINLCRDANCIFDIGANTGLYSLIAKSVNKDAQVYAYEPVKRVFDKLIFNNQLNNFDIKCSMYAISNNIGKAIIYDVPNTDHIYSVTVNKNMADSKTPTIETEIQTITLDSVIENEKIGKIDLLKIDVETHEPEVLEGYSKYIHQHNPTLLIEVLDDTVGQAIQAILKDLDYLYFNIDENKGLNQVDTILKSDYYNYLICSSEIAKKLKLI